MLHCSVKNIFVATGFSVLMLLALVFGAAAAGTGNGATAAYSMQVDGEDIGGMRVTRTMDGQGGLDLRVTYDIVISGFFTEERLSLAKDLAFVDGRLRSVVSTIVGDDGKVVIRGKAGTEGLVCDLAATGEPSERFVISAASYDVLDEGLAVYAMTGGEFVAGKRVRLLDSIEFEAEEATLSWQGEETIRAAGRSFQCRRLEVISDEGHSTLWLARDSHGPMLVKEEGKDCDGPYSIMLRSYDLQG